MGQIKKPGQTPAVMTLKAVAQHLGLTPGTVSAVLNDSPSARSIPQDTKNRIHAAAKELNYRPNFFARTLRNKLNLHHRSDCGRDWRLLQFADYQRH